MLRPDSAAAALAAASASYLLHRHIILATAQSRPLPEALRSHHHFRQPGRRPAECAIPPAATASGSDPPARCAAAPAGPALAHAPSAGPRPLPTPDPPNPQPSRSRSLPPGPRATASTCAAAAARRPAAGPAGTAGRTPSWPAAGTPTAAAAGRPRAPAESREWGWGPGRRGKASAVQGLGERSSPRDGDGCVGAVGSGGGQGRRVGGSHSSASPLTALRSERNLG